MSDAREYFQDNGEPIKDPEARAAMQVMQEQIKTVAIDVSEMRADLRLLVSGLERVVRLEEGRMQHNEAIGRAFDRIKSHDDRLTKLEIEMPLIKTINRWIIAGATALIGVVGLQLINLLTGAGA